MLAATATFVVGDSFMKLVTEDLPPFEVLFLRGIAASLACAVLLTVRGEWRVRLWPTWLASKRLRRFPRPTQWALCTSFRLPQL